MRLVVEKQELFEVLCKTEDKEVYRFKVRDYIVRGHPYD